MPIFEFLCDSCGESFEELVRGANAIEGLYCPTCNSEKIRKKVSLFASRRAGGEALGSGAFSPNTPTGSSCKTNT
jgi:putative FmdB family regulatory protein